MMRRLLGALARFETTWMADAIGAICLFVTLYASLWFGAILGLQ